MRVTEEEQIKLQAKPGDLFICEGGEPGRCAVWRDSSQQIVFQKALHRFRPNESSDSDFVSFYLYWLSLNGTLSSFFTGTTIKHLTGKALAEVPVSLPTLNEQKQIIIEINKLLPLIEEYGKAHSALKNAEEALPDQLRASLLQEAIQGKLVPQLDDEPAVDMAGEEPDEVPFAIPEKWKWITIRDVVDRHLGGGTPSKSDSTYWGGNIPWASVKDMKGERLSSTEDFITEKGLANSASNLIPAGNLIVCMRMGLGKIVFNDIDVAINQDLRALFLKPCILPEYFFYFYKSCQIVGSGVTVKGIKIGELLSMPIPLPPLCEQRRIVARLEELLPHVDAIAVK